MAKLAVVEIYSKLVCILPLKYEYDILELSFEYVLPSCATVYLRRPKPI